MPPTSVVAEPNGTLGQGGGPVPFAAPIPSPAEYSVTMVLASAADAMYPWGKVGFIGPRDGQLRAFWPQEDWFASALYTTVARYAAFAWSIEGGRNTAARVQNLLHSAEHGQGWIPLITKVLIDLYTQDNGAFIEIVRQELAADSPPVELNHLDSGRCVRTGDRSFPVIYYDINGKGHRMPWFSVVDLTEFPSPDERFRGMQVCALSRCLQTAQIMRDKTTYDWEKVSGRFNKQIHLVSGASTKMIEDAISKNQANADNQGLSRFVQSVVMGTLDPNARVTSATINLAEMPDGFDPEVFMRWYVAKLALAFGVDYSDFAPLPGQNIGSGNQAQVGLLKSRGKGPAMFMKRVEHAFNWHGVMPRTVTFRFGEMDTAAEYENTLLRKTRAEYLEVLLRAKAITPEVARQMLVDWGDLSEAYLAVMQEENATPTINVDDSNRPEPEPTGVKPGEPGPKDTNPPAPPNNNAEQSPPPGTQRPKITS